MTEPETTMPALDMTLTDAVQEMNGFEALMVERHFNQKLEELGGVSLAIGVVWVYENRGGKKRSWPSVEKMTFRELHSYFLPEPDDVNEAEPDSDVGKGD